VRVLITGSKGQLGTELNRLGSDHELLALDYDALDITDIDAVMLCMDAFQPDILINAAAYTAVDEAESDVEAAYAVNRDGSANLAKACERDAIPLIHISTDYVFDGSKQGEYCEADPVAPLGIYGSSKLEGELAVKKECSKYIILRTSWVFSAHGNNFVKTMLRLGVERETLGVVADQYGCPTSASELARAIYAVLESRLDESYWGVYHFCQPEATTWFGFSEAVFEQARKQKMSLQVNTLNAIATENYPTPVKRPANSVLNCSRFSQTFEFEIKPWLESLQEVIKELKDA